MTILRGLAGFLIAGGIALTPFAAFTYPGGAPAGFAGDVSGGSGPQTCAVCHSSFDLNSGTGGVSIDGPAQFAPGETVQITVAVDNQTTPVSGGAVRQGFEAAVKDPATGEHVGTLALVDAANTRFAQGSSDYVTHTSGGAAQTSWTFEWTAPATVAPSAVRIYAAGNAANGGNGASGDHVYTATTDLALSGVATTEPPEAMAFDLNRPSPNPVRGEVASLDLVVNDPGTVSVRVVDGRGRTVRHVIERGWAPGSHVVTIPTRGLAAGIYFVVASGEDGVRTQPLLVAR